MVTFRRRKKSSIMQENKAPEEARDQNMQQGEEIKVTDRRRINIDGTKTDDDTLVEEPNLKPSYVEELEARTRAAEQKMADVQSRFDQLKAQLQRETDETRQRLNKAADQRARREKGEFISSLLPVADNLNRAIDAAENGGSIDQLLDGLKGTAAGFDNALLAAGAEPIASVGTQFDPETHEAVDLIDVEPDRDGIVTAEYSRGYKLGDQLLRPARVQVGRATGARHQSAE
jgi:molecular chaperone GrpE